MTKKIAGLLNEYFENDIRFSNRKPITSVCDVISPKTSSWEVHSDPERFSKRFKFDSRPRMISFVNEVMEHEDQVKHHGEIRIDYTEVDITVYTHDVNKITELDREYIQSVDEIHRDVLDFEY